MNEPANFGTNEAKPWNWPDDRLPYWSLKCPQSKWDNPPYRTSKYRQLIHLHIQSRNTQSHV